MTYLIDIAEQLLNLQDRLQQAKKTKRQRIANHFLNIAQCLTDSVEQINNGIEPLGKWGELETYGWELQEIIGKEIGTEKARALAKLLVRTASKTPTNEDIESIKTAAGKFKAIANNTLARNSTDRHTFLTYMALAAAGAVGGSLISQWIGSNGSDTSSQPDRFTTDIEQFPIKNWTMHTFLSTNVENTILWKAPEMVCKRIRQMTNDRFVIELKRTGETEEILSKVHEGDIECGYSGIYYTSEKYKALFFGCAVPFGLNPQEQNAWLNYKQNTDTDNELTYIQSIYKDKLDLNVIPFPAGATGVQMGGWFNKEVNTVSDLEGLVMRIPGLGADVLGEFGVKNHRDLGGQEVALDEAIRRLRDQGKNKFDAVEWTGPWDDRELGLDKAAKYYYYPGWWEPGTTFDVQVNIEAWEALPKNYQEIFKVACYETHTSILAEYDRQNSIALTEMVQQGIQLRQFSSAILTAAEEETKKLLELYAQQNAIFNEVYIEWRKFKKQIQEWSKLDKIS